MKWTTDLRVSRSQRLPSRLQASRLLVPHQSATTITINILRIWAPRTWRIAFDYIIIYQMRNDQAYNTGLEVKTVKVYILRHKLIIKKRYKFTNPVGILTLSGQPVTGSQRPRFLPIDPCPETDTRLAAVVF